MCCFGCIVVKCESKMGDKLNFVLKEGGGIVSIKYLMLFMFLLMVELLII